MTNKSVLYKEGQIYLYLVTPEKLMSGLCIKLQFSVSRTKGLEKCPHWQWHYSYIKEKWKISITIGQ